MTAANRLNYTFGLPGQRLQKIEVKKTRSGPVGKFYYLRAWDSGTGGYVTWGPYSAGNANLSPTSDLTTPNYTGVLSNPHVFLIK